MMYVIPVLYNYPTHTSVTSLLTELGLVDLSVHCIYHAACVYNSRFLPLLFSLLTSAF